MAALRKFSGGSSFAELNTVHVGAEYGIWYQHRLDTLYSRKKNYKRGQDKVWNYVRQIWRVRNLSAMDFDLKKKNKIKQIIIILLKNIYD